MLEKVAEHVATTNGNDGNALIITATYQQATQLSKNPIIAEYVKTKKIEFSSCNVHDLDKLRGYKQTPAIFVDHYVYDNIESMARQSGKTYATI